MAMFGIQKWQCFGYKIAVFWIQNGGAFNIKWRRLEYKIAVLRIQKWRCLEYKLAVFDMQNNAYGQLTD